jgi:hypothetical protein
MIVSLCEEGAGANKNLERFLIFCSRLLFRVSNRAKTK